MPTSSEIRYSIAQYQRRIDDPLTAEPTKALARVVIAKKQVKLGLALRREARRLVEVLTYKADIYCKHGRIFSCDGTWAEDLTRPEAPGVCFTHRKHGAKWVFGLDELTDGHGRTIDADSKY